MSVSEDVICVQCLTSKKSRGEDNPRAVYFIGPHFAIFVYSNEDNKQQISVRQLDPSPTPSTIDYFPLLGLFPFFLLCLEICKSFCALNLGTIADINTFATSPITPKHDFVLLPHLVEKVQWLQMLEHLQSP